MQLIYFWVEKFEGLNNFQINLSSQYNFRYKSEDNRLYIEETAKRHLIFKTIFKEYDIINDLVVIVGKNGSGKTSVARFINQLHLEPRCTCILVYSDGNSLYYAINNIHFNFEENSTPQTKAILLMEQVNDNSVRINPHNYTGLHSDNNKANITKSTKTIYYSNLFDDTNLDVRHNFINISTNKRVMESRANIEKSNNEESNKINFRNRTYNRQYTKDKIDEYIDFKEHTLFRDYFISKKLYFSFESHSINTSLSNIYDNSDVNIYLSQLLNKVIKYPITPKCRIIKDFFQNVLSPLFETYCKDVQNYIDDSEYKGVNSDDFIECVEPLLTLYKSKYSDNFKKELKSIIIITKFLLENDTMDDCGKVSELKVRELNKLIESCEPLVKESVSIEVRNLSSGEIALLNMYSRFSTLLHDNRKCAFTKEKQQLYVGEEENITIFIDECDLYLHPEWQRRYIKDFLDMCKIIFKLTKINVILTTHSPIILSDIPSGNIRFIAKNKNDESIDCEEPEETFGANIYDLYKNAFFLNSLDGGITGTISAERIRFAKNEILKIKKSIEKNSNNIDFTYSDENISSIIDFNILEECSNIVSIIGESVIKNYLKSELDYINKVINDSGTVKTKNNKIANIQGIYEMLNAKDKNEFIQYIINSNK